MSSVKVSDLVRNGKKESQKLAPPRHRHQAKLVVVFFFLFCLVFYRRYQGRSQDFSKGEGYTVSNIIAMAFSPRNIVGCLFKKGL